MKYLLPLAILAMAVNCFSAEELIDLSPIPPIGAEVQRTSDGAVRIEMSQAGTLILGTAKINSLPGSTDPNFPGRYHIEFTAAGKNISKVAGSEVSLVVYLNSGKFNVSSAHGGRVLLPASRNWSDMRTRYLANSGGSVKPVEVILGVHFQDAGSIELKDLSCKAVALSTD